MDRVIYKDKHICVRESDYKSSIHIELKNHFGEIQKMFITKEDFKKIAKELV